jgi:diguanylate cyclase (GGDEF)-like protein
MRREFSLSAVPSVVVGSCDTETCYSAGADECVAVLDLQTVERIRARSAKMREIWDKAVRDDLTGLYKRQFLDNYLEDQFKRFQKTGIPFSIMMCDLDYFKKVNDTYGHQTGDAVLKELARFLTSVVREVDIVARYGGEEFIVVFACLEDARGIAERACRNWANREITVPGGGKIRSTFSAGVAVMTKEIGDIQTLIKVADNALYEAKESGRNRVVVATSITGKKSSTAQLIEGLTVTSDIKHIEQVVKNPKYHIVVIDADIDGATLSRHFKLESNAWMHDWGIGLSAKPYRVGKMVELYSSVPGDDFEDRDIRAMKDIILNATSEKKNVLVYYRDQNLIEVLKQKLEEDSDGLCARA